MSERDFGHWFLEGDHAFECRGGEIFTYLFFITPVWREQSASEGQRRVLPLRHTHASSAVRVSERERPAYVQGTLCILCGWDVWVLALLPQTYLTLLRCGNAVSEPVYMLATVTGGVMAKTGGGASPDPLQIKGSSSVI